jgi:hypothetical protein
MTDVQEFPEEKVAPSMEYQGVTIIDSPDEMDYEEMTPKAASAAIFNQPKRETFLFPLSQTGIKHGQDMYAEVRLVNLLDRATLNTVAPEVRQIVQRLFFAGEANQRGSNKKESPEQRMERQMKRLKEVGYAYGAAGFVNPRLVMRPEDVRDPNKETWVGNIELADLTEFVRICEGADVLAKRRLQSFPE